MLKVIVFIITEDMSCTLERLSVLFFSS